MRRCARTGRPAQIGGQRNRRCAIDRRRISRCTGSRTATPAHLINRYPVNKYRTVAALGVRGVKLDCMTGRSGHKRIGSLNNPTVIGYGMKCPDYSVVNQDTERILAQRAGSVRLGPPDFIAVADHKSADCLINGNCSLKNSVLAAAESGIAKRRTAVGNRIITCRIVAPTASHRIILVARYIRCLKTGVGHR